MLDKNICEIDLPYSCKLFLQELQCMSIVPRLNVGEDEKNILNELFKKDELEYSDEEEYSDEDQDQDN